MTLLASAALVGALHAVPCEYHIDSASWPRAAVVKLHVRVTAKDGTVATLTGFFQPKTTPQDVRDLLAYHLEDDGCHGRKVAKTIYVIEGVNKSSVRSIEFISDSWKPGVRWVPLLPQKK
jgi:hypothetical protein